MDETRSFSKDILAIDCEREVNRIANRMREILAYKLKRRGFIVAISNGIETFEQRIIFLVFSFMTDFLIFYIELPFNESERKRLSGL